MLIKNNHSRVDVLGSNLNILMRLLFASIIITTNNLPFMIYYENVVKILWI